MITKVNDLCVKMFTMENFGEWLLAQLNEAKISQSELARRAGLSKGTISNLINGTKGVGQDSLSAIARALHFPAEYVFEKAGVLPQKPGINQLTRQLIHETENWTDDEIDELLIIAKAKNEKRKRGHNTNETKAVGRNI